MVRALVSHQCGTGTRRHMWVEFVVGSRPCSEGFSPGSPVFLPPQKPTFLNSNSIWKARTRLNELPELFGAPWVNKLFIIYLLLTGLEVMTSAMSVQCSTN